jgi:hypothetical protein
LLGMALGKVGEVLTEPEFSPGEIILIGLEGERPRDRETLLPVRKSRHMGGAA